MWNPEPSGTLLNFVELNPEEPCGTLRNPVEPYRVTGAGGISAGANRGNISSRIDR